MVRRNIFQPPAPPLEDPAQEAKSRFPTTGTMSGVRETLRDLSTNAVRDIDTALIDETGPKDRLTFSEDDIASLAASIAKHGQQVPIMLRPNEDKPGRFLIVYGRRRLHALRKLGIAAKALIRSLSDAQAVLAQGHENAQRLDPSFIEKALFAKELTNAGYENAIIQDALAIDKAMLSRMNKVTRQIPSAVVEKIGPAHGIGRRRWEELADKTTQFEIDLEALAADLPPTFSALASEDRFAALLDALEAEKRSAPLPDDRSEPQLVIAAGRPVAELRSTRTALTIKVSKRTTPEFALWLQDNAASELTRLYEAWLANGPDDNPKQ